MVFGGNAQFEVLPQSPAMERQTRGKIVTGFGGIVLAVALLAVPAARAADVTQPLPALHTEPLSNDGLQHCAYITNDCEVCVVETDGKASCSSTGIACVPTRRWCLVPGK